MVAYLLDGIQAGLLLALLVGPLLVLLIQLSIRRGTVASLAAAVGIWTSDLLFVLVTHYGLGGLRRVLNHPNFEEIVGSVGGLLLLGIGVAMWFRRPVRLNRKRGVMPRKRGLLSAWLQGFAVNSLNPFTVFFWSAFTLTQVHQPGLEAGAALMVYAGILGTIIVTDLVKVLAARRLRDWLRPEVILRAQRVGAVALAVFGLGLVARVWW